MRHKWPTMRMAGESSDLKEVKKLLKPLVEKRRRDRMNRSLDQLKSFLMKHSQIESFRNGKMEKAEILEMTVEYLRNAALANGQEQHSTEITRQNYEAGFKECLLQVNSFIRSCGRLNSQTKSSLMERLAFFVDQSSEEKQSGRIPECGPDLPSLRAGQPEREDWDVKAPGAATTGRPLAIVAAVGSAPSTHTVSNPLPTRPVPSHHSINRINFVVTDHELNDSGCAHIENFPQKITESPKPAFTQRHPGRITVPHSVWRPWP